LHIFKRVRSRWVNKLQDIYFSCNQHVLLFYVADTVRVYDYVSKTPMCQAKYNSGGSSLLWVPKDVSVKVTQPEDWGEEREVESPYMLRGSQS